MKQKLIVTALPNGLVSRAGANAWKVSASIGLQVEDADTTLQNVKDMRNRVFILHYFILCFIDSITYQFIDNINILCSYFMIFFLRYNEVTCKNLVYTGEGQLCPLFIQSRNSVKICLFACNRIESCIGKNCLGSWTS